MSKPAKILIIEDEPDISTYLQTILTAHGFETLTCDSAGKGMDMVKEFRPNLVSLDIMMPHETGMSFFVKLRQSKEYSKTPVIVVSGAVTQKEFDLKSFVPNDEITPPEHYMEKPIDVEEFVEVVQKLIEASSGNKGRKGK